MNLAPIVLFVYNRPKHTRQTIESLKNNLLANESSLFIFSDGPKTESDSKKIDEVRSYIRAINGFNKLEIEESKSNKGLARSVIEGVTKIINMHSKVIVLEDDIVCSSGFLKYMNEALNYYEKNEKIFSVSGYCFPINIPIDYKGDVFILPRASTWGWGTWANRWHKADWDIKDYKEFLHSNSMQSMFNLGGEDLTPMLKAQMRGQLDSWGIRWTYAHFKNNAFCLYPVSSKVKNIGADKSGTHTARTQKFEVSLDNKLNSIIFPKELHLDNDIHSSLLKLLKLSMQRKIINLFRYSYLFNRKMQ